MSELAIQIIYQLIGILALLASVFSFQFKKMNSLLLMQGIAALLWAIHFIVGKAYAGAMMNSLSIFRSIGFMFIASPKGRKIFTGIISLGFVGLSVLSVLVFKELWFIALLTSSATVVGNIFFMIGNNNWYRYAQIGYISPCWLFNNIWYMSIGGIICESFVIISAIVSLIRFNMKKNVSN